MRRTIQGKEGAGCEERCPKAACRCWRRRYLLRTRKDHHVKVSDGNGETQLSAALSIAPNISMNAPQNCFNSIFSRMRYLNVEFLTLHHYIGVENLLRALKTLHYKLDCVQLFIYLANINLFLGTDYDQFDSLDPVTNVLLRSVISGILTMATKIGKRKQRSAWII